MKSKIFYCLLWLLRVGGRVGERIESQSVCFPFYLIGWSQNDKERRRASERGQKIHSFTFFCPEEKVVYVIVQGKPKERETHQFFSKEVFSSNMRLESVLIFWIYCSSAYDRRENELRSLHIWTRKELKSAFRICFFPSRFSWIFLKTM